MSQNKTKPTSVSIDAFLNTLSNTRRTESQTLIDMMRKIPGEEPVAWGPSIIGFGLQHYKSEAGREGDMGILGFSPRKASLTVYFYEGFDRYGEEFSRLGKHKTSVSCLYINKLADINLDVLEIMLKSSYKIATSAKNELTVDDYVASVPELAREKLDHLRQLAREILPEDHEVISYGVIGYKPDIKKRAVVFVSGWKDHVAIYPVPKDEALLPKLKPYIKGKGTLWFGLDQPLPNDLIVQIIESLKSSVAPKILKLSKPAAV